MNSLDTDLSRQTPALVTALPAPPPPIEGVEFKPKQIYRAIRRQIAIVLLVPALAMLAAAAVTAMTPRQYQAIATLQIEQNGTKVLSTQDTQPTAVAEDAERFLQTQVGLLNSKAMAAQVVDSLGLAKDGRALRDLGMPARPPRS